MRATRQKNAQLRRVPGVGRRSRVFRTVDRFVSDKYTPTGYGPHSGADRIRAVDL